MADRDLEFDAIVLAWRDGALTDEQFAALQERLLTDDDARTAFTAALYRHRQIQRVILADDAPEILEATPIASESPAPLAPAEPEKTYPIYRKGYEPQPSRFRPHHYAIMGIAAALLIAGIVVTVTLVSWDPNPADDNPEPVTPRAIATLIETTGDLSVPHGYADEGAEYAAGDYTLSSGHAQFVLTNRVTVELQGDTRLRMYHPGSVYLARGSAEFKVPKEAKGFTVHLPDQSEIIDLGTAFRVEIDDEGHPKLRVLKGSVMWTPAVADGVEAKSVVVAAGQTALMIDGVPTPTANPGLVAYWPLNDGADGETVIGADDVIDDDDHPATDATVEGEGETWVEDADRGIVLSTTATGNLIAGTQGITGDFTWSLWTKTDESSHRVVMGNRGGSTPWNKLTTIGLNNWATIGAPEGDFGVADGAWHHMVVRRAGESVAVYIDGTLVGEPATTDTEQNGPLRIGGDPIFGERVTALMSDVAIWDIALSDDRITALAGGGPVVLPEPNETAAPDEPALTVRDNQDTQSRQRVGDKD